MQKVTRDILIDRAAELLASGMVNRVLGLKSDEYF